MKCVNFTNKTENLLKKAAAGLLSAVFMLNMVSPMLKFDRIHAAGASWRGIFEKPTELADGTYKTAGDADDVVGYINFGQRPEVKYQDKDYNETAAAAGPIKWLIIGQDTGGTLKLYSKEPLMSANRYDSNSNSIFDPDISYPYKKTVNPYGEVYIDHYGASNFRKNLQNVAGNTSYFKSAEQGLMLSTTVKTTDTLSNAEYTTADKLYGLHSDNWGSSYTKIYARQNNQLPIAISYCRAYHWLRSPGTSSNDYALITFPRDYVFDTYVNHSKPAVAAAFKLGLSDVFFAANAVVPDTASSGNAFSTLDFFSSINTFNFRIKGEEVGGSVANNNGVLTYTANSDERRAPR